MEANHIGCICMSTLLSTFCCCTKTLWVEYKKQSREPEKRKTNAYNFTKDLHESLVSGLVIIYEYQQDKYKMDPGRQIYLSNNKKIFGQKWFWNNKIKNLFKFKQLYLAHILSKFQVVQTTASLCNNVVSHIKSQKTSKSQKKGSGRYCTAWTRFF